MDKTQAEKILNVYYTAFFCIKEDMAPFFSAIGKIVNTLYDRLLEEASIDNEKWYHYYKNAKKQRTRDKYEKLLQEVVLKNRRIKAPLPKPD